MWWLWREGVNNTAAPIFASTVRFLSWFLCVKELDALLLADTASQEQRSIPKHLHQLFLFAASEGQS